MAKRNEIEAFFGAKRINSAPPFYKHREGVDDEFIEGIQSNKHIVVFGSAKQGKTSLVKKHIDGSNQICIHCKGLRSIEDVYTSILKELGFEINYSSEKSSKDLRKLSFGIKLSTLIGLSSDISRDFEDVTKTSKKPLEFDIKDVTDIIRAIKSFGTAQFIILEDFHHLEEEVQKEFAQHLKLFSELSSTVFIVTGIWMSDDRFLQLNRELRGLITNINVDIWKKEELMDVIETGEALLDLHLQIATKELIVENSMGCISILQEICLCVFKKLQEKVLSKENSEEPKEPHVYAAINLILKNYDAAFISFVTNIKKAGTGPAIDYYKTIVYCILTTKTNILRYGIQLQEIFKVCENALPSEAVDILELHQALKKLKDFQIFNKVVPPFLEYDEGERRLHVTDKIFLLWIASKKKLELLEDANFEIDWVLRSKWIGLY